MDRNRRIIRTSALGIAANLVLAAFKAAVGLAAHSIAVLLDAVNNLSDALSSIITIVGTKLSGRKPDKKHPYGYGRIEYLTSVAIAVIVLLAGVTSLRESVEKTIHPEDTSYTYVSLLIIGVAVAVKLALGSYVKKVGREIDSGALVASGSDASFDALLSLATLAAAAARLLWGLRLEGVLGVVISLVIVKAGVGMLMETLDSLIGVRVEAELSGELKALVGSFPQVRGVYDVTLHNYGPSQIIGSAHIELADDMPAREIHILTHAISERVYREMGIVLTLGIYAAWQDSALLNAVRESASEYAREHPEILQLHAFFCDETEKRISFDMVVDFEADAAAVREGVRAQLQEAHPGYRFDIVLDSDYSD